MIRALLDGQHLSFAQPYYFLLLLLLPLYFWYRWRSSSARQPSFRVTSLAALAQLAPSWRVRLIPTLLVLRSIAFVALVVALARPQSSSINESIDSNGIDIVLSIDVSGSMMAEDLKPNRIEAAKQVAQDFVAKRPNDRIGLVIFSGESFTQCPITIDHNILNEQIASIKSGMLQDGTAIGMGLATAVDRLRNAKAKSKIIILLTDGVNNTGLIDPSTSLEIAKAYKLRVYCIGVGTRGQAPYPVQTPMGMSKQMVPVEIDEALLKNIASQTGGQYYRATSNSSLAAVYKEIDKLEKSKVEVSSIKHFTDLFLPFALLALICLVLELLLRLSVFRSIT
ncbi:MAG: VWA domain-containing protein [Chitinophagaceae bacterium]|nr:VWA domain-containing protein [Chitinophagaceae bacterium]